MKYLEAEGELGGSLAEEGGGPSRFSHLCKAENLPAATAAKGPHPAPSSWLDSIDSGGGGTGDTDAGSFTGGASGSDGVAIELGLPMASTLDDWATSGAGGMPSLSGPKMNVLTTSGEENGAKFACLSMLSLKSNGALNWPLVLDTKQMKNCNQTNLFHSF